MDGMKFNQVQDLWVLDSRVSQTTRHGIDNVGACTGRRAQPQPGGLQRRRPGHRGQGRLGRRCGTRPTPSTACDGSASRLAGGDRRHLHLARRPLGLLRRCAPWRQRPDRRRPRGRRSSSRAATTAAPSATASSTPPATGRRMDIWDQGRRRRRDPGLTAASSAQWRRRGGNCQTWDDSRTMWRSTRAGASARAPVPVNRVLRNLHADAAEQPVHRRGGLFGRIGSEVVPCPLNLLRAAARRWR